MLDVVVSDRSRCLRKGGLGLRRVGPTPNTGQNSKSKDKYCFHLSILVA